MLISQRLFLFIGLLLVLVIPAGVSGQIMDGHRAGFFGGLNFANQGGDMNDVGPALATAFGEEFGGVWHWEKKISSGFCVGAHYTLQTSPTFGVQFEGQYARRGTRIDLTGSEVSSFTGVLVVKNAFQLDYVELPILARFSPAPAARIRPVFLVGPSISFQIASTLKTSAEGESHSTEISDGYTASVVGLVGGAGVSAMLDKSTHLVFQARYYQGLTTPMDDDDIDARSRDFAFLVGFEYLLGAQDPTGVRAVR